MAHDWDSLTPPTKTQTATTEQIEAEIDQFKDMLDELASIWTRQPKATKENDLKARCADLLFLLRKGHHQVEYYADRGE